MTCFAPLFPTEDGVTEEVGAFQRLVATPSPLNEYWAVRRGVGVTDDSARAKFSISGQDARTWLDQRLAGDVESLQEGVIRHTLALDDAGDMICDLFLWGGFDEYFVTAELSAQTALAAHLRAAEDLDVVFEDLTESHVLVRMDGPGTADLPRQLLGAGAAGLGLMRHVDLEFGSSQIKLGRVGLTGEFGFVICAPRAEATAITDALRAAAPSLEVCGRAVHDLLQLETRSFNSRRDRPRNEHPLEAGLHWMVGFRKEAFTGKDALDAQKAAGLAQKMVCVLVEGGAQPPANGAILKIAGNEAGYVANGAFSPTLEKPACLAYVTRPYAFVGVPVEVEVDHQWLRGQIVSAPFFVTESNRTNA